MATENGEGKQQEKAEKDYGRTDKRPHSFRYKRGTVFGPRSGDVKLSREPDGSLVIGPTPEEGAVQEAETYGGGAMKLVAIKKRANGKQAISFQHETLGTVLVYDARSARATLRAAGVKG